MMKVKKAIFPVAGFGTRFLPATKAQPKEMLPIVDKPAIQYVVEQAVDAGIEDIIFVTGRGKRAIEDHFDYSFELDYNLVEKNKYELVEKVRKVSKLANFSYVRQAMPLGDGHAVNCGSHLVKNEAVLVIFGDTLYDAKVSIARQVIDAYYKYQAPVIGLTEVEKDEVSKFGIYGGDFENESELKINTLVEKPKQEDAPSNLAAVGVYVVTPEIFGILSNMKSGNSGEIRLIDAFEVMMEQGKSIYGKKLEGEWLDTGNKFNFIKATMKLGIKDEEIGEDLKKFIKKMSSEI